MNLSEDTHLTLNMIEEAAASLLKPDAALARAARSADVDYDNDTWQNMTSQGWLDILRLDDPANDGVGVRAAVMVAERLGYAGRPQPFIGVAMMAMQCLMQCSNKTLAEELMSGIAESGKLVGLAWQSYAGALDANTSAITSRLEGGNVVLNGRARFVLAHGAETFIVAARAGDETVLCAVPREKLTVEHEEMADGGRSGLLALDNVTVASASILAQGAQADQALGGAIELGVLGTAAELLGAIDRSLDITLDYLGTRKQFGKLIGSFQVLQHRAVDIWMQKELTRAALKAAVAVFSDPDATADDRRAAASSAKARASQVATFVTGQTIQLHGAIGFTDEYELGAYVNRSLRLSAQLGNAALHRQRYGTLVKVQEQ